MLSINNMAICTLTRKDNMIEVYFDGACNPTNPGGTATYAFIINLDNHLLKAENGIVGKGKNMSNNVAEYFAILKALEYMKKCEFLHKEIIVYGDSDMVIKQLSGKWKAKKGLYFPYYIQAKDIIKEFTCIGLIWIPREENTFADELTKCL